jgi:hypothetical protein
MHGQKAGERHRSWDIIVVIGGGTAALASYPTLKVAGSISPK